MYYGLWYPMARQAWVMCLLVGMALPTAEVSGELFSLRLQLDLGQDLGQSFGTVFTVRDADGRVVAGAGFPDVYNTRFRSDRHTLQFFVRPTAAHDGVEVRRLPHPDLGCGIYLLDHGDNVFAWTSAQAAGIRRWDRPGARWVTQSPTGATPVRTGDGIMQLGTGKLVFASNRVWWNGRLVLVTPEDAVDYNYYYAQGYLCFYRRVYELDREATYVCVCAWRPGDPTRELNDQLIRMRVKYERETPFAWGQWKDQLVTVSNQGGVYVFQNDRWRTVVEADNRVSYQVYSMVNWNGRLLMAQYPTGNLFEYRGDVPEQLVDWPPRMQGVSSSARECQTLSIYRGELMAGVWPWAELWRLAPDEQNWKFVTRPFTHPEITDAQVHPYEAEAKSLGLVANFWGQRITGLVPIGDSLYLSTSAKGTVPWREHYRFLSEPQRREYGALLQLRKPGCLAVPIRWKDGPTTFEFVVDDQGLRVKQEGISLGNSPLGHTGIPWSSVSVSLGDGVFGKLRGTVVDAANQDGPQTSIDR